MVQASQIMCRCLSCALCCRLRCWPLCVPRLPGADSRCLARSAATTRRIWRQAFDAARPRPAGRRCLRAVAFKEQEQGGGEAAAAPETAEARVIVVTSGKGGVGKTTATANIGMSIARLGYKVALLDAGACSVMCAPKLAARGRQPLLLPPLRRRVGACRVLARGSYLPFLAALCTSVTNGLF